MPYTAPTVYFISFYMPLLSQFIHVDIVCSHVMHLDTVLSHTKLVQMPALGWPVMTALSVLRLVRRSGLYILGGCTNRQTNIRIIILDLYLT